MNWLPIAEAPKFEEAGTPCKFAPDAILGWAGTDLALPAVWRPASGNGGDGAGEGEWRLVGGGVISRPPTHFIAWPKPPQDESAYDPRSFWVDRHEELAGDPRSVGNRGHTIEAVEEGYKRRGEEIRAFLIRHIPEISGRSVLEFGCGIGMIAEALKPLGVAYTGLDISPVALEDARKRAPEGEYIEADIIQYDPARAFDVVMTSAVLCHMVEPGHWRAVLKNMADSVAPGGALVLAEDLPEEAPVTYSNYVIHRTIGETAAELAKHGFRLAPEHSARRVHIARRQ